jgi:hypothetical protein
MEAAMSEAQGGCLCGAVRFRLQWPSLWAAHCHCSLCQRAHGAAYVTWVGMAEDHVWVDDAQRQLRWYVSSPGAERGFCARCGSSLFFRSKRWAGELHIARANFEGTIDRLPSEHVFWDTHVDWVSLDQNDGLPRRLDHEID